MATSKRMFGLCVLFACHLICPAIRAEDLAQPREELDLESLGSGQSETPGAADGAVDRAFTLEQILDLPDAEEAPVALAAQSARAELAAAEPDGDSGGGGEGGSGGGGPAIPSSNCAFTGMPKAVESYGRWITRSSRFDCKHAVFSAGGTVINPAAGGAERFDVRGNVAPPLALPIAPPELAPAAAGTLTLHHGFWAKLLNTLLKDFLSWIVGRFIPFGDLVGRFIPDILKKDRIGQATLVLTSGCQWSARKERLTEEPGALAQYVLAAGVEMPVDARTAERLFDKMFDTGRTRGGIRFTRVAYSLADGRPSAVWGSWTLPKVAYVAGIVRIGGRPHAVFTRATGVFREAVSRWSGEGVQITRGGE